MQARCHALHGMICWEVGNDMLLRASGANSSAAGMFNVQGQRAADTQGSTSLEHV